MSSSREGKESRRVGEYTLCVPMQHWWVWNIQWLWNTEQSRHKQQKKILHIQLSSHLSVCFIGPELLGKVSEVRIASQQTEPADSYLSSQMYIFLLHQFVYTLSNLLHFNTINYGMQQRRDDKKIQPCKDTDCFWNLMTYTIINETREGGHGEINKCHQVRGAGLQRPPLRLLRGL